MKHLSDVLAFVHAGGRPVVTFNAEIEGCKAYAEAGMKARIVGGRRNETDVIMFHLDYSEFDAHNRAIESRMFSVATDAVALLFEEFSKAPAGGGTSYVAWLERSLLEARARPHETPRTVLQAATAVAGDAFDGLVEFYPSVLTPFRKADFVLISVRQVMVRELVGDAKHEHGYETLKGEIEIEAKRAQAHLCDWRDLAELACDDMFAYYPWMLDDEESRVELIDSALAQITGGRLLAGIADREECRSHLNGLMGQDVAKRHVARAERPAS